MKNATTLREIADHAQAENESGVIAGQPVEQAFLDGVEQALRWAAGDSAGVEITALILRAQEAGR